MADQKKITNFFTAALSPKISTTPKRPFEEIKDDQNGHVEQPEKLKKTEVGTELTIEQLKRVENNKLNAIIIRQSKVTPALHANIGTTWFKALEPEFKKPYFAKLSEFVVSERKSHTVYPKEDHVFSWTHHTLINEVKVVILGQDPYHNPGQAHGLCFSVPITTKPPPSLVNMYKELADDIPGFSIPSHGNLTGWAKQGVLLLNASLTVRAHNANSHKDKGWEEFTSAVVKYISDNLDGVVFLLWGSYAKKKGSSVNKKKHLILSCAHPSPLSAYNGFFGCKHFSQANKYLKEKKKKPIDWGRLPAEC